LQIVVFFLFFIPIIYIGKKILGVSLFSSYPIKNTKQFLQSFGAHIGAIFIAILLSDWLLNYLAQ